MRDKRKLVADKLMQLIDKREALQISAWEFEAKKRKILGLPPQGLHPLIRNLLACLIVSSTIFGLAIAYPAYAKMLFLSICAALVAAVVAFFFAVGQNTDRPSMRLGRFLFGTKNRRH